MIWEPSLVTADVGRLPPTIITTRRLPMPEQILNLASWNVNGLRAVLKKDFMASVERLDADVLGIQETKLQGHQLTPEMTELPGYQSYWSHALTK